MCLLLKIKLYSFGFWQKKISLHMKWLPFSFDTVQLEGSQPLKIAGFLFGSGVSITGFYSDELSHELRFA